MMRISLKLIDKYMAIFFNFPPTSSHLHPLQVQNRDSNSRLVVDEMTMVNSGLKGLKRSWFNTKSNQGLIFLDGSMDLLEQLQTVVLLPGILR